LIQTSDYGLTIENSGVVTAQLIFMYGIIS